MADIVLGIGSSHGPLLSTPPDQWDLRARADRANKSHWFRGKTYDYDALLQARAPGFAKEIEPAVRERRFHECRSALETLGRTFDHAAPDAVVIVGNDQREFFNPGLTPAITVYRGAEVHNVQHIVAGQDGLNIAEPANSPEAGAVYPGAPALADHILDALRDEDWDLAQSDMTPSGAPRGGIPHAYGFFYHTILKDRTPPSVPVIAAMTAGDEDALAKLPEYYFKVGTAEIKNWLPVIAAMNAAGLKYHHVDYVPCYRSEAGTGNAMCFAYWE